MIEPAFVNRHKSIAGDRAGYCLHTMWPDASSLLLVLQPTQKISEVLDHAKDASITTARRGDNAGDPNVPCV